MVKKKYKRRCKNYLFEFITIKKTQYTIELNYVGKSGLEPPTLPIPSG